MQEPRQLEHLAHCPKRRLLDRKVVVVGMDPAGIQGKELRALELMASSLMCYLQLQLLERGLSEHQQAPEEAKALAAVGCPTLQELSLVLV